MKLWPQDAAEALVFGGLCVVLIAGTLALAERWQWTMEEIAGFGLVCVVVVLVIDTVATMATRGRQ